MNTFHFIHATGLRSGAMTAAAMTKGICSVLGTRDGGWRVGHDVKGLGGFLGCCFSFCRATGGIRGWAFFTLHEFAMRLYVCV